MSDEEKCIGYATISTIVRTALYSVRAIDGVLLFDPFQSLSTERSK